MRLFFSLLLVLISFATVSAQEFVAGTLDGRTIRLVFPEAVDKASAESLTNYALTLVRKETKDLSTNEIAELVSAMVKMKTVPSHFKPNTNAYDYFPEIHMTASSDHAGIHRSPLFLPWHREFLRRFEFELRRVSGNPLLTLPWWDWADHSTTNIVFSDIFMGGDGDPNDHGFVKSGPFRVGEFPMHVIDPTDEEFDDEHGDFPSSAHAWLTRGFGKDDDLEGLPTRAEVDEALAPTRVYDVYPWDSRSDPNRSFRNYLEGWRRDRSRLHNRVHLWVGGQMQSGASPNDPIFFLNHANVDRIWSHWNTLYGSATYPDSFRGPNMLGFPEVSAESQFEIQDSGIRYSTETPRGAILSAQLQPDNRTLLLTVTNAGVRNFTVNILGVNTLSGTNLRGSVSAKINRLQTNNVSAIAAGSELHLTASGGGFDDESFSSLIHVITNDFDLEVEINNVAAGHEAGLVAVDNLANPTKGIALYREGSGSVAIIIYRGATNEMFHFSTNANWLRLQRHGTTLTAFISTNRLHWTLLVATTVATESLNVGIAAATGSATPAEFRFNHFGNHIPIPRPEIVATFFQGDVVLTWFSFDDDSVLEFSEDLEHWEEIAPSMYGHNEADIEPTDELGFFRLRRGDSMPGSEGKHDH